MSFTAAGANEARLDVDVYATVWTPFDPEHDLEPLIQWAEYVDLVRENDG